MKERASRPSPKTRSHSATTAEITNGNAIAPKTTKKEVDSAQAAKKLPSLRTVANTIYMSLKREGFAISTTIIKEKILELYPSPEDWSLDDARKDVIRALKKQQGWKEEITNFLDEVKW